MKARVEDEQPLHPSPADAFDESVFGDYFPDYLYNAKYSGVTKAARS